MEVINKPRGTYADYISGDYSDKYFVFELIKRNAEVSNNAQGNPIPGMRSKETGKTVPYPLSKPVPLYGTVIVEEKENGKIRKFPRKIKYVEGEDEIFVHKQLKETPETKKPLIFINFVKGRYQVDGTNSTLLKFMFTWDANETNQNRDKRKAAIFRLVDTSTLAKKSMEVNKAKFNAIKWCWDGDWKNEVRPLANAIFSRETMLQNSDEIRHNLAVLAERDPNGFSAMLSDEKTQRRIVIREALDRDIIVKNPAVNGLFWADNPSSPIYIAAPGKDVITDFVANSFSSRGLELFEAIEALVYPSENNAGIPITNQAGQVFEAPMIKEALATDEELRSLVREAVDKGVITTLKNGGWYKFLDSSYQKEDGMVKALKDNEMMYRSLKQRVFPE